LELEGAASAGVCVAILALQTRGQVLEKAIYRTLGTVVGAIASIVLTDVFLQTRDLYIIAYSAWLGHEQRKCNDREDQHAMNGRRLPWRNRNALAPADMMPNTHSVRSRRPASSKPRR
jgi:hypothetical protein